MRSHRAWIFSSVVTTILVAGCTSAPHTPAAVEPQSIDTSNLAPKVDAFVVGLDASSSMAGKYQGRQKFHIAQDLVASINATVPPLPYDATLLAFGTGPCMESQPVEFLNGPGPYARAEFAAGLESIECAGGTTPMPAAISESRRIIASGANPLAVVLVSDFQDIDTQSTVEAATRLKEAYGDRVCLHLVKIGDDSAADSLIGGITGIDDCGSSVTADEIASPAAMAGFVEAALLAPLQYTRTTVSATALFDFDSAVLKEQGKAELRALGEEIRSQGATVADIDVVGHTDSTGSAQYNQELSLRRATAVRDFLVSAGVDGSIIDVSGRGQDEPVASNETDQGRAKNRRVDIFVGVAQADT